MTDNDTLPNETSSPLNHIWNGLTTGDPGPFVAFFDSLMNSDFAFAAGGLLRDVAERIVGAAEAFEDKSIRDRFVATATQAMLVCVQHEEAELQSLLKEAAE